MKSSQQTQQTPKRKNKEDHRSKYILIRDKLTTELLKLQQRVDKLEHPDSRHINVYRKLDRLDTALFSISSIVGLAFTIIVLSLGEIGALIFLPTLIVGWFMPFYVWYKGGALSKSLIQRVRGLTYFFTSIALYSVITVIMAFEFSRGTLPKILEQIGILSVIIVSSLVLIYVINKRVAKKIYGREISPRENRTMNITIDSAIRNVALLLGSFTSLYFGYKLLPLSTYFAVEIIVLLFIGVFILIIGIASLILNERKIRHELRGRTEA